MNPLSLRTRSLSSRNRRVTSWSRSSRLRSRSSYGNVSTNWRKRCRTLSTQQLDKLKSSPWRKRSTECSSNMNCSERNRKSWSKIWRDASSRERPSSSSISPRSRKRTPRTDPPKVNYPAKLPTSSRTWNIRLSRPCSLTQLLHRESEKSTMSATTSTERKKLMSRMASSSVRGRLTCSIRSLRELRSPTQIGSLKSWVSITAKLPLTASNRKCPRSRPAPTLSKNAKRTQSLRASSTIWDNKTLPWKRSWPSWPSGDPFIFEKNIKMEIFGVYVILDGKCTVLKTRRGLYFHKIRELLQACSEIR